MTDPAPESASPALADGLAAEITVIYSTAETEIFAVITTRVRSSIAAANVTAALLNDSQLAQQDTATVLARLDRKSAAAARRALSEAYGRGNRRDRLVADRTLQDALGRLRTIRDAIRRWTRSVWQRLIGLSAQPDGPKLIGQTLQREAGRGITVPATTGRPRGAVSLATETVQHAAGGAAIDGFADRLTEDGRDLVIVTLSPHPCPVCRPWERKVLSLTGDDEHPSMATARAAGLFHPRCRHTVFAWSPGFEWPPHSIEHLPGSYAAEQRQRTIERHIREWKRRDAAAVDDVTKLAAKRKTRQWETALRRHLAATGLQRSRQRERTDFGHTRPLRHAHGR